MCYNKDNKKGKKSKLLTLFLLILGHFCCSVVTSVTFSDNLSIFLIRKKRKVNYFFFPKKKKNQKNPKNYDFCYIPLKIEKVKALKKERRKKI